MVLSAKYSKDGIEKVFYIDYRFSHTADLVFPYWKKKFEDLNFFPLELETFKQAFNEILENKIFICKDFSLRLISIDR